MKKLILFPVFIFLSSCISIPMSKEALINSGNRNSEFCTVQQRLDVEANVEKYLSKCFRPNNLSINGANYSTNFTYSKEKSESQTNYFVTMPMKGGTAYLFSVKVMQGENACKTNVVSYASMLTWAQNFKKIEESANGNVPGCAM